MLLTVLASLVLSLAPQDGGLSCPVLGAPANPTNQGIDYNGVRYKFCCGGCDAAFMKDPAAVLKDEKIKGKTVGVALFDPISGKRIDEKKFKASSDFNGTRFLFESAENKAIFDLDPKKHGAMPKYESLICPIKQKVVTYATADGFVDYDGVRYYTCCGSCTPMARADGAKFIAADKKDAAKPKPVRSPKN